MRYHIVFSYDGSKFFGYQKQPRKRTIQSELEKALKQINNRKKVLISSSGRTDAGVHAINQNAHFDLSIKISSNSLKRALNSLLPDDIYVKKVYNVSEDFHARFDVKRKEYIYKINVGEYNPIEKDYIYQYNKPLNVKYMKKAIKYIKGEHNFKSFVKGVREDNNYVRKIFKSKVYYSKKSGIIIISLVGNGFMRYMVRNIVGTLMDIGSSKHQYNYIKSLLESGDRKKAGKCAPACGLYLKDVYY